MYEHLNKIYVQIGTKWTRDFNQVYIIIYFFNLLILCLQFFLTFIIAFSL